MSDTGFNFEIKVDGVDKALTGTSKVAEHLEMLQEVLPKLADESRRSFHRVTSSMFRVEVSTLRLRESIRDLGFDFTETGSYGVRSFYSVNTSAKDFIRTVVASRSRVRLLSEELRSMPNFGGSTNQQQQTNNAQTQTPQPNQNSGSVSQGVVARKIPDATIRSVERYTEALQHASDASLQLELDSANLHSVFGSVGSAASGAKAELDSFSSVGVKSVGSVSTVLDNLTTKTLQAKSTVASLVSEFSKLAKNFNLKSNMNLNLNVSVNMPKVIPVSVKLNSNSLVTMQARINNMTSVNVRNMMVNGKVFVTNNQSQTNNNNNNSGGRGNNKNDPGAMIRQYVGVALASVASYNVVRSGFSGTVEEARFNNEWQSMTRELAAVFKPLMEAATDATRYVRQQLEKLDSNQQDLLMYGALGTVGAIGLHKMGMLGAVAGTGGAGLMTAGRGVAGVAGAATTGLGGAKTVTGLGALLSVGMVGYEKYQEFKGLRAAQRIMTTPMSKLNPDEQMAMLKTGQDVEGMSDEDKREVRRRYADATRRRREQRMADEGKNPDGTEMGFMGRMTNRVGNFFGSLGIGGSERREDEKTRRDIRVLDMAAKHRFAMTGKGDRNPFGDLNNLTKEEMDKAGRGPEPRRLMLAQSGFGEAGGLRDDLQTQALILAAVAQNEKILGKDKNQQENMTPEEKLIRVLEKLDKRLAGENEKPDDRPAPPVMIGAR